MYGKSSTGTCPNNNSDGFPDLWTWGHSAQK